MATSRNLFPCARQFGPGFATSAAHAGGTSASHRANDGHFRPLHLFDGGTGADYSLD